MTEEELIDFANNHVSDCCNADLKITRNKYNVIGWECKKCGYVCAATKLNQQR